MNIKDIEILPIKLKINVVQFLGVHTIAPIFKDIVESFEELKNT